MDRITDHGFDYELSIALGIMDWIIEWIMDNGSKNGYNELIHGLDYDIFISLVLPQGSTVMWGGCFYLNLSS